MIVHVVRRIHTTVVLSVLLLLLVAPLWSAACASDETTDGATTDGAVGDVIRDYFSHYYHSLEQLRVDGSIWDCVVDTDDTHLYLCALQYGINWRKALDSGLITDSAVESVDLQSVDARQDGAIDIKAYVTVGFRYHDDESGRMTSVGDTWYITCRTEDGRLKIVALDSPFSSDYQLAKELTAANLEKNAGNRLYTKTDAIDDAYVVINSRIEDFREPPPSSTSTSAGERD